MTQEYKCPCCGGTIEFDSNTQKMKCPYCDSTFEVESLKEYDDVLKEEEKKEDRGDFKTDQSEWNDDGLMHYVCSSCGGEIITNETLASTVCPYCSNNVILMDKFEGTLKPDLVIPFKLDKKKAVASFRDALKGKFLLSRAFTDENHLSEIKGVYVPVWLFTSSADASITYRAVTKRVWSDPHFTYTQTSHYLLQRQGNIAFDKIPVDGSRNMDDSLMEALGPFDYSQAVDFQTAYLSGYLADKYDITAEDSKPRAIERAKSSVERYFRKTTENFLTPQMQSESVNLSGGECSYALLPVWLLNTKWNGKNYLFAVNGQSGKFVGDLPCDNKKAGIEFASLTAGIGAVLFLLFYLAQTL